MLGVIQMSLVLLACSGDGESGSLEGPSLVREDLAGRTFLLTTDPITRSLPESAEVVFLADGRLKTEKTGVGETWEVDAHGRIAIPPRVYVRDTERPGCWFSPHASGFAVGWRLCPLGAERTPSDTDPR